MDFLHCVGFLLVLIGANLWCVSGRLCYFGQEPDPDQRGKLRWVLPVERQDLCSCSEIRQGGLNMVIPKRAFQPYYTDHPIFTDNQEIIHDYFKCHGDCEAKVRAGYKWSGVYTIYPPKYTGGLRVYCNVWRKHGWIVLQRRFMNGTLNFNRTWAEYKEGFGILTGEFWLGNEILRMLTKDRGDRSKWVIRMDLQDEDGKMYYRRKIPFRVSSNNYTLHVGNRAKICVRRRIKNNEIKITVSSNVSKQEYCGSSRWCPDSQDENPWFKIDTGTKQFEVKGVFIKGQEMEFQVEYSNDNITWRNVTAKGACNEPMMLKSNFTGVTRMFGTAKKRRYFRIKPTGTLNRDVLIELIGCKVYSSYENRVGMENGVIRNENIIASSSGNEYLYGCSTRHARLNSGKNTGWCPAPNDTHPWLQLDLGKTVKVQGVEMQGGKKGWVKKYRVEYQSIWDSDAEWQNVTESPHSNKIFYGEGKRSKIVPSNFYEPIKAHVIRIFPTTFDDPYPVMRVELIGTEGDMFDKTDKQSFSTYDNDNDGDEENCASLSQQGWWYNGCRNVSQTEYSDQHVDRFDQIVKVEFKIRRYP